MAERTVNQTLAGATIAISASLPATYDAAGYGATAMTYTTIGQVGEYGEHGVQAQINTFTAVADAVVQKFKGSKDYGSMSITMAHLPSDAGQDLVAAAAESQNRYSVKITYPTGTGESTPEIHYLDVLVTQHRYQDGDANNVRKLMATFELCRAPVVVAAT